jgi:hypothetical protein
MVFGDSKRGIQITLTLELDADCRIVLVEAEPADLDEIGATFAKLLGIVSVQELKRRALADAGTDPKTLIRLAYGLFGGMDDEVREIFQRAFKHGDPRVRETAVVASRLVRSPLWSQFYDDLARDPNPRVRAAVERIRTTPPRSPVERRLVWSPTANPLRRTR